MRVGNGYDVHRLVEGRKLILCGVEIPFEKGLLGHSDADVAAHAIIDALFGAAGLNDIGSHFPDTDARYKNADSMKLMEEAAALIQKAGFRVGNVDAVIVAQRPKLLPYFPKMKENVAKTLNVSESQINIKGKTEETLGFTGRQEGMKAYAVALLEEIENRGEQR